MDSLVWVRGPEYVERALRSARTILYDQAHHVIFSESPLKNAFRAYFEGRNNTLSRLSWFNACIYRLNTAHHPFVRLDELIWMND